MISGRTPEDEGRGASGYTSRGSLEDEGRIANCGRGTGAAGIEDWFCSFRSSEPYGRPPSWLYDRLSTRLASSSEDMDGEGEII